MDPQIPPLTPVEKIERGIVERLKVGGLSAEYLIQVFPDDPDAFDFGDAKKVALVQYSGSRYEVPDAIGAAQSQAPEFAIHLYLRSVGKPIRAPFEIRNIRLALQGQVIEGAGLFITRDGLVEQDGAMWRYLIEINTTTILAAPLTQSRVSPMLMNPSKEQG